MNNFTVPWRVFLLTVLATLASVNAFGLSTKHYRTEIKVATGSGSVYASNNYVQPKEADYKQDTISLSSEDSISYVFAKPAEGNGFSSWEVVSGTIDLSKQDLTANPLMIANIGTGTDTIVKLRANFVPAAVSVASEDNTLGTVSISNANNSDGETVTLSATPSDNTFKASAFDGWYYGGKRVSRKSSYELTITSDNKGVYTAKFERRAGYFRVKSMYNRYAYLIGDSASEAVKSQDNWAGVKFDGSIAMKSESELDNSDLSYIVKIDGITDLSTGGLKDLDVTSQGISARNIISELYPSAVVNARPSGNNWTFYYHYATNDRFLKDGYYYGYDYAIACGGESDHLWSLERVDAIPLTSEVSDDSYSYTTLYTSFPYEIGSNIKVNYMQKADFPNNIKSLRAKEVPAFTPIILSWPNYVEPEIYPIFSADSLPIENNILEGVININGNKVKVTDDTYVLGIDENGKVAFVKANAGLEISSNRAYIDYSKIKSEGNASKKHLATGINAINSKTSPDNSFYDLSGRKIENPQKLTKGIYIKNGKKIIIR